MTFGDVVSHISAIGGLLSPILIGVVGWITSYFRQLRERIERLESNSVHKAEMNPRLAELEKDVEIIKRLLFLMADKLGIHAGALDR